MGSNFFGLLTKQLALVVFFVCFAWLITGSLMVSVSLVFILYVLWNSLVFSAIRASIDSDLKIEWLGTRGFYSELYSAIQGLIKQSWGYRKRFISLISEVNALAGSLPDAGIIVNNRLIIEWCNKASKELLGINSAHDIGQRIDQLLRYPAFLEYLQNPKADYLDIEDQANKRHLRFRVIRYNKDKRLISARDVTQQVKTNEIRQDFIANASHELKTPLTTIKGYSELIVDSNFNPQELNSLATVITAQVDRMNKIIEDLLTLSKIESRSVSIDKEEIDVTELLLQVVRAFEYLVDRPETKIDSTSTRMLLADEQLLHSIVENLLSNAYRYTPKEGGIILRSRDYEHETIIEVIDSGLGIPNNEISRITERFYRIDKGRHSGTGGTGLGLAIVKHSLDLLGGTLEIESEINRGSIFRCRFPIKNR
jgi:two-component system, OmpR family, phosphate regulon sensor histidine kinase PhoR